MRNILFNDYDQEELINKGYIIKPFISSEECASLLDKFLQLNPNDKFAPSGNENFTRSTIHTTFLDTNEDYKRKADELIREVFSSHIESLLNNYKILTGNFFVKPSGRGKLDIHQNWSFLQDVNDTTLTVWCPLVDVNELNGTIQLVEGSHKITPNIVTPNCPPAYNGLEEIIVNNYSKPISLKAGDCLIFDDNIIHWSGKNKSSSPRYVVQILCIPIESKPVFYYLDPTTPEKGFEVLEMDKDFFIENSITD